MALYFELEIIADLANKTHSPFQILIYEYFINISVTKYKNFTNEKILRGQYIVLTYVAL